MQRKYDNFVYVSLYYGIVSSRGPGSVFVSSFKLNRYNSSLKLWKKWSSECRGYENHRDGGAAAGRRWFWPPEFLRKISLWSSSLYSGNPIISKEVSGNI